MNQMINNQAAVLARIPFGELAGGFFRGIGGKIFFAGAIGNFVVGFPVREDGVISNAGELAPFPNEIANIIHPRDLGIVEIKWEN